MKIKVGVTFEVEGTHRWKDCPFDDVSFLRNYHRHIFKFKVVVPVTHAERDLEIIRLKTLAKKLASSYLENPTDDSCETLCIKLGTALKSFYQLNEVEVHCYEDGENGAEVIL